MLRDLPEGTVLLSRMTRVEVYPTGALIERQASVKLEEGRHRLVLPALPESVDPAALYISGFGADASAGSTFVEAGTLVEARPKHLVELEQRLAKAERQQRTLTDREAVLGKRLELLVANSVSLGGGPRLAPEQLTALLDRAEAELTGLHARIAEVQQQSAELEPEVTALREQHQALLAELQRPVKHVVVEVTTRRATELPLVVRYYVGGPTWEPRHVARWNPREDKLTLETYAWVVQRTGESWEEVQLVVAAARAERGLRAPSGHALLVQLQKGHERVAGQAHRLRELATSPARGFGQQARRFTLKDKASVLSGQRGQRVLLETLTLTAEARRVAIPRVAPGVYLELALRNPRLTSLLAGAVALFHGSDYVGTASLPAVLPGEQVVLPFGPDPEVHIERRLAGREATQRGRTQKIAYRLEYTLRSGLGRPARVVVKEQLPTSRDRLVRVTTTADELGSSKGGRDEPAGTRIWTVTVPPGGEEAWTLGYSVSAPVGRRVAGID